MFFALLLGAYSRIASPHHKEMRMGFLEPARNSVSKSLTGAYVSDHVQVNVNDQFRAKDLLDELEMMYGNLGERKVTQKEAEGGIWISGTAGSILFSAYYHATKRHTVKVKAGTDAQTLPAEEEWVEPGQWAIIYTVMTGSSGYEVFYDIDSDYETNSNVYVLPASIAAAKFVQKREESNELVASDLPVQSLSEHAANSQPEEKPLLANDLPIKSLGEYTEENKESKENYYPGYHSYYRLPIANGGC